jgi:UDP-glucuronate 4-epimerase
MFRFFTVYGPWGRPDMAPMKFARLILSGQPIEIYNHGEMWRDFTYVGDLVRAIALLIDAVPRRPAAPAQIVAGDSLSPVAPFRIVNIGNSDKVRLLDFVDALEAELGVRAERRMLPIQPGDVPATWADAALLERLTGFRPATPVAEGIAALVAWLRSGEAGPGHDGRG